MNSGRPGRRALLKYAGAITLAAGVSFSWGQTASRPTVKIGFVMNLTGVGQVYGTDQKAGFELAVEEINKAGGVNGANIEGVYRDPASEPKQTVTAFEELIKREKVVTIIGPTSSAEAFQAFPLAVKEKIPVVPTSANANGIPEIGEYIHRFSIPEQVLLPSVGKKATEAFGLKKVAIMYAAEDPFAVSGYQAFKQSFETEKVQIVATEAYNKKDPDFAPQLSKIKATNPDAIVIVGYAEDGAAIATQARNLGIKARFIGNSGFGSPQLVKLAGAAVEGSIVGTVWSVDDPDPVNVAFVKAFRAKFNRDPGTFAAQAYNTVYFVAASLQKAGRNDSASLQRTLLTMPSFKKVGSPVTLQGRSGVGPAIVLEIKDGKFVVLK